MRRTIWPILTAPFLVSFLLASFFLAAQAATPVPAPSESVCRAWSEKWAQSSERAEHFAACMKTTEGPILEARQREADQASRASSEKKRASEIKKWKPERVRLTRNPQATAGCSFVGDVEANALIEVDVEMVLRLEAAKRGGDLVLETVSNRSVVVGEAYRCKRSRPAATPTPKP